MRRTSRKRILNITSKKKVNDMMPWQVNYNNTSNAAGASTFNGTGRVTTLWCATAMDRVSAEGTNEDPKAGRTSADIFLRGIKENTIFRANTGTGWKWRRIVFAVKGLFSLVPGLVDSIETSAGWTRAVVNISGDSASAVRNNLEAIVFEGAGNLDWWSTFTAKVDRKRVRLLYDKTRMLQSHNDVAHYHSAKMWIPINKNVCYDDIQAGDDELTGKYSVTSKQGFGDVYVMDFFECASGQSTDLLQFEPQAAVYWHER